MKLKLNRKVTLPIAGAVVGLLSVLAIWHYFVEPDLGPETVVSEVAFRGFNSVEGLADQSDVVVVGSVKKVLGREVDTGGDAPQIPGVTPSGIPTIFYEVTVHERLKGEPGDTIVLARTDPAEQYSQHEKPIEIGQRVLLFLLYRTGDAPGFRRFRDTQDLYVTIGLDNGVFELSEDSIASPRWPDKFRVVEGRDDDSAFKTSFTMDEIRAGVAVNDLPSGSDDDDVPGGLLEEPPPSASPISVN